MRARYLLLLAGLALLAAHLLRHARRPEPLAAIAPPPRAAPRTPSTKAAPPPRALAAEIEDTHTHTALLSKIKSCRESEDRCRLPQNDPRSYDFAVGQALKAELTRFTAWVAREKVEENAVSVSAREFLADADGHVQEAALKLIATQPTSPENLQAILDNVIGGYDANLIEIALNELQRYQDVRDRDKIDEALARALINGAPFLAREISARLDPFVDARSAAFFRDVVHRLPEGSVFRDNLTTSLHRFHAEGA